MKSLDTCLVEFVVFFLISMEANQGSVFMIGKVNTLIFFFLYSVAGVPVSVITVVRFCKFIRHVAGCQCFL